MTTALELSWCARGEVIRVDAIDGRVEPMMVVSSCDTVARGYRCVTCAEQLANVGQLVLHIADGGAHRIVTYCSRHRVYEAAEASQIDGFARAQAASW